MRISNATLQRVYLQALQNETLRVPGKKLALLIAEVARARGLRLYDLEPEPEKDESRMWDAFMSCINPFKK